MVQQVRLIDQSGGVEHLHEVPVTEPEFLIGRGVDCNLRLRSSEVSRHHCIVRQAAGEALLVDLGSINGTYLNGQRVRSQAPLHSGDLVQIGATTFVVDLGDGGYRNPRLIAEPDPAAATIRTADPTKPASGEPE